VVHEAKPELHVSVWIGDLAKIPAQVASAASAAEERGGRDFVVTESEDGSELTIGFVLQDVSEDVAREIGHAVLDAIDADDYVWTLSVLESS
jgi:hypothetical protein